MVEIRATSRPKFLRSDFNAFLYASIGENRAGGKLSVVSALARLDIDPWQEAEKLSHLSSEAAMNHLSSFIAKYPEWTFETGDRSLLAQSLIALLPSQKRATAAQNLSMGSEQQIARARTASLFFLLAASMLLAAQFFYNSPGFFSTDEKTPNASVAILHLKSLVSYGAPK